MKKKVVIIGILLLFIYFGYKCFYLFKYDILDGDVKYNEFINELVFNDEVVIKINLLDDSDYIQILNLKFRNDFKDFEIINNVSNTMLINYDKNYGILISTTDSMVNLLKNNYDIFSMYDGDNKIDSRDIITKNNINNDLDLFRFINDNRNVKSNIFTSVKKMKENSLIRKLAYNLVSMNSSITPFSGDVNGFIINANSNVRTVYLSGNDKYYILNFLPSSYFSLDYVIELLSTFVIDFE